MTTVSTRLHMLTTGSMTSALGGFLEGEPGDFTYPIPIYVIERPNALVVVDTGLHPDLATNTSRLKKAEGRFHPHLPEDGSGSVGPVLEAAGFDPAQVTHAVLTHLHFDHTGGLCELPNATVVLQGSEWRELRNEELVASGAYNPDDVDLGHDRQELAGDHDLFGDGSITCLLTDGHTVGHQSVRVATDTGTFVICGDCCYLRRTLTNEHLPPWGTNRVRQLASVRRMGAEQANGATLLFGHDPEQWAKVQVEGLHSGV